VKTGLKVVYSPGRLASQVARLGRTISRDYAGRTVDVVIILENAFVFGADLVRRISRPVVCHFVRSEMRDVKLGGYDRREVFFGHQPHLQGRDVLLVDAVLHSGVTQDFLLKRLQEGRPHSLRVAVLLDKPQDRKVDLKPDYFGFAAASKHLAGYGLAGRREWYRNLPYVGLLEGAQRSAAVPGKGARRLSRRARRVR
jgi:hypoxanthine phosphoribosyltransferase